MDELDRQRASDGCAGLHPASGLDKLDLKILSILQRDGRITKTRLAEAVNLSQTPCGARIERLEKAGLIRGYHADVDLHKLACLSRFMVTIEIGNDVPGVARRFEAALQEFPNVIECAAVLGDIDYIATVVASSIAHYLELMEKLSALTFAEITYTTYPVSKSVKRLANSELSSLITGTPHEG